MTYIWQLFILLIQFCDIKIQLMNIWTLRVHTFDHALFGHWNNQTYESWTGIANNAHQKSDSIKKTMTNLSVTLVIDNNAHNVLYISFFLCYIKYSQTICTVCSCTILVKGVFDLQFDFFFKRTNTYIYIYVSSSDRRHYLKTFHFLLKNKILACYIYDVKYQTHNKDIHCG